MSDKIPQFWDKGIMLVDGCTKVSPGCKNCWSEAMTARFKRVPEVLTDGRFNGRVQFNLHLLEKAAKRKEPTVYAIWNDLYHAGIAKISRVAAMAIMNYATQHTWLIVTKRPQAFTEGFLDTVPDNVWHIVTCENQAMADKRIPHLLRIPGKRGIIIEPMLGPVDLMTIGSKCRCYLNLKASTRASKGLHGGYSCPQHESLFDIHQVILGPENGPGKRPFDPAWAESVKAQCEAAGVPYYRKDKAEGTLAWRPGN